MQQKLSGYCGRGATSQRDAFAQRERLQFVDEQVFGYQLQIHGYGRRKGHIHQLEGEQASQKWQGDVARRALMLHDLDQHFALLDYRGIAGNCLDCSCR